MRYQSNRPKRQFLAGVACPKCKKMDAVVQIQVFEPAFDEWIECTACDHSERRPTMDETAIMRQTDGYGDGGVGVVKFK
ncbi:YheV family putative metal-binding protein [Moraxella nasibovis]|uniref:YheV family putative metal-binding protein n=1 Tax=Moraxella nasibovis TaxID=2904120 RepID=UPI00240EC0B9|nr:YheV family putative metal-binding protein [Moraxella nasibovis]WFF38775.1 YheV family putative metal-binding protein [Moraxella nasibovis]